MDREQIARASVAAGLFVLALVAVFSLWFVLPSMHGGQGAMAQDEMGPPDMMGPSGDIMGDPMMGDMGMPGAAGAAPAAAAPAAPAAPPSPPLEPSRANPFIPLDVPEPEIKYVTSATRYGPDWSTYPVGYFTALPQPEIPPAPPPPLPPSPTATADLVRISSVVWPQQDVGVGAPGRAFATYEDPQGRTRLAVPGQQIDVERPGTTQRESWRVIAVEPEAVVLRNLRTGETSRVRPQARSRAERRYFGAEQMSEDISRSQAAGRVIPGRDAIVPDGTTAPATGAMPGAGPGMEGGMGMPGMEMPGMGMPGMMPGMPGMP